MGGGGADACIYGLVDTLRLRPAYFLHLRGHQEGIRYFVGRGNARTVAPGWRDRGYVAHDCQFPLRHTFTSPSTRRGFLGVDTGIAQGRVLSPLLFNLLVNSLAAAIRRASPGVRLLPLSIFRFTCQLYADDLVILAESVCGLRLALTAATLWGQQWRFFFWDGPREISCHGLWTSSFKAIMFSFSQRTVVACRLF